MSRDHAADMLSRAGLKKTPGRLAVIQLLLENREPLTHQEIYERLDDIEINPVSIYRSLDAFTRAGIVHKVEAGDRVGRFALCGCGTPQEGHGHCHPHFICKSCGRTECLEDQEMPELAAVKPGYKVEEKEVYLRGICSRCAG